MSARRASATAGITPCRDKPTAQNGDQGSSHGYLPQCDSPAQFSPVQCHRSSCWCVDGESQEIIGTRTQDSVTPPSPGPAFVGSEHLPIFVCVSLLVISGP
uniref:Thyroglobulin type-1 domain-containing protein n=1 Tax=Paramormyrops kingsleyae TaxID=1676925 RepID=A0A3B3QI37_9TELE